MVTRWSSGDGLGRRPYREPASRAVPDATGFPPRRLVMLLSSFTGGESEVQKSGNLGSRSGKERSRGLIPGPSHSMPTLSEHYAALPSSSGELSGVVMHQLMWLLLRATLAPRKVRQNRQFLPWTSEI